MVYKKYVYKRGRKHGPYYYHSYRDGDSVKKIYIGGKKEHKEWIKKRKRDFKKEKKVFKRGGTTYKSNLFKLKIIIPVLILLIITGFFIYQMSITGRVGLDVQDSYVVGENLTGNLRINLKQGELLPIDSKLVIEQDGIVKELFLSEVLLSNINGSFYVEGVEISGEGEGYGFIGEKIIYPEVFFKLEIYDVGEELEEESEEDEDEEESEEDEEGGGSPITGEAVKEDQRKAIIDGICSKGNDFIYELEEGKTAKIKKNSVRVEEEDEKGKIKKKKISDDAVNLEISDVQAVVSTDYSVIEQGFGEDYLTGETDYVDINLEEFGIEALEGTLTISLVYSGIKLAEVSEEILVMGEEIPENITEVNITEVNITGVDITTKQYKAIINRPVKWIKTIRGKDLSEIDPLILELPKGAENITIKTGEEVQEALDEINEYEQVIDKTDRQGFITGQVTGEVSLEIRRSRGVLTRFWEWLTGLTITGNIIYEEEIKGDITETDESKIIDLVGVANQTQENEIGVEYYTDAPVSDEINIPGGRRIIISASSELGYTKILAYSLLDNFVSINETEKIRLSWVREIREESEEKEEQIEQEITEQTTQGTNETQNNSMIIGKVIEDNINILENNISESSDSEVSSNIIKQEVDFSAYDLDEDGFVDYIEWEVPYLSEQVYEIIYITKAEHLDENRDFISDIYEDVREKDDNWSEEIPAEHYVRVTFERVLDKTKDITIYARAENDSAEIEVYTEDSDTLITKFTDVSDEDWYKVYLSNLNGSHDVFDLKIIGSAIEFDYIVDPVTSLSFAYPTNTTYTNYVTELNYTHTNASYCWHSIDDGATNSSIVSAGTNWTGLTGNSSLGNSNTWTLYCNDSIGLENSTSVTFTVDDIKPDITYGTGTETDNANLNRDNVFVNVSASDSLGNISTFIDFDGSLVGWWRMDDTNGSANSVVDRSAYCYDNETKILTDEGLKYFWELTGDEMVMTLNAETGEREWQLPMERQEFDYEGKMYRIKTKKGDLTVSPEHNVYFKSRGEDKEKVSIIQKIKSLKDEVIKLFAVGLNKFMLMI